MPQLSVGAEYEMDYITSSLTITLSGDHADKMESLYKHLENSLPARVRKSFNYMLIRVRENGRVLMICFTQCLDEAMIAPIRDATDRFVRNLAPA